MELLVLIVAECNVNIKIIHFSLSVSSVLIVAECNVNSISFTNVILLIIVLIVAECNVNVVDNSKKIKEIESFNSSRV